MPSPAVFGQQALGDLWYASPEDQLGAGRPGAVLLNDLRDPFDRFILATAAQLGVPLATADRAISKAGTIEIVW